MSMVFDSDLRHFTHLLGDVEADFKVFESNSFKKNRLYVFAIIDKQSQAKLVEYVNESIKEGEFPAPQHPIEGAHDLPGYTRMHLGFDFDCGTSDMYAFCEGCQVEFIHCNVNTLCPYCLNRE